MKITIFHALVSNREVSELISNETGYNNVELAYSLFALKRLPNKTQLKGYESVIIINIISIIHNNNNGLQYRFRVD